MNYVYFFDVAVYSLSEQDYYKKRDLYIDKLLNKNQEFYEKNPDSKNMLIKHSNKSFGGQWQYNEIIGYIRLHILGSQVRGEYFVTNVEKHVKTRKKQFEYSTHKLAPEIELPLTKTNLEIYQIILLYLEACGRELPNRFIDTALFRSIGPHIDWKNFIMNKN